jgi:hypothetical protein
VDHPNVRFARSRRVLSRTVGAGVLVTTPDDPNVHELSGGAAAVWGDLEVPRTLPELVDRLAGAHAVGEDQIAGQIRACLDDLVALGVVEEVQGSDG